MNAGWDWDADSESFTWNVELYPFDVRPQGHDIISFWLFHTVVKCYEHTGEVPFDSVMINGMVLDENREKMSKSKGNVVSPARCMTSSRSTPHATGPPAPPSATTSRTRRETSKLVNGSSRSSGTPRGWSTSSRRPPGPTSPRNWTRSTSGFWPNSTRLSIGHGEVRGLRVLEGPRRPAEFLLEHVL